MRRVLIGTPSYDGRIDVWFANSLIATVKEAEKKGIFVHAIYTSYDSLIQRARNSLVKLALDGKYDDIFFIDSDTEWEPEWFFRLLERPEPIVGGALIKKTDKEGYTVKLLDKQLKFSEDGKLIQADGVGTGFLKVSRFALEKLWLASDPYTSEGEEHRMVFDIKVENGDLISEDYVLCNKWKNLGYKVWLDPTITCNHIGIKKFKGDLNKFLDKQGYVRGSSDV
jgi:glycosyltransferase involved in cell wall biosynthesis